MLKLRLKKFGRKGLPSYRLVVIEHSEKRDGRPVEELGFYDSISKRSSFNTDKIIKWLNCGAKPSPTVFALLKKAKIIQNK
jgi:small subunit ribosomal protein S16|uniref:Small ribosomal subunit protein bS16c n=1 Tax=Acanthoceras zachariasii TaxID=451788 RepID=A0A2U9NTU9_9STRA|nr:ribosomal protein S16 [Acanthoceras zachariasii]AWT40528.1 ribosomal protein S16 [Acanthoceras zachariasii]